MNQPTINGNEYSWVNILVNMMGNALPVDGITGIRYKAKMDKKNIYGRGNRPIARGTGNKEYDGSLTLLQSEVEALLLAAGPGKDLTDIAPFNIAVTYIDDVGNMVYHQLEYCEFVEFEHAMKSGDPNMEIECPLIIGNIKYSK